MAASPEPPSVCKIPGIAQRRRVAEKEIAFERHDDVCAIKVPLCLDRLAEEIVQGAEFGLVIDCLPRVPLRPGELFQDLAKLGGLGWRRDRGSEQTKAGALLLLLCLQCLYQRGEKCVP